MDVRVKILVASHKPSSYPKDEIYLPIHVGKATSELDLGIQADNEGDNISEKNYCYCELTALYWAWKNLKDVDVIGLCHYRRYFDFHEQGTRFLPSAIFPSSAFSKLDFSVDQETINRVLNGEVVVCRAKYLNSTLKLHYCEYHFSDDYRVLKEVIDERQEAKYRNAFKKVFECGYKLHPYNMMVMRKKDFDDYCTWVFELLSMVEKRIDISNYSIHQKRIFGFMAERLLNVWLEAEEKELLEKPLAFFDEQTRLPYPRKYAFRKTKNYLKERFRCFLINQLYNKTPQ